MKINDERIKQISEKLQCYLEHIDTNEEYMKLLRFQAQFYRYSVNNCILIRLTKPESSYVASYTAWKRIDRYVRRGERGIKIIAPVIRKVEDENNNEEKKVVGYRLASVFDLSQTEGSNEHLPEVVGGLEDKGEITEDKLTELVEACPVPVIFRNHMAAKGMYDGEAREISVNTSYSLPQNVKTLLHEWAHYLCDICQLGLGYAEEECVAESVAYIVSMHIGIDAKDYSVPYVATWQKESGSLLQLLETVRKLSRMLLRQCGVSDETNPIVSGMIGGIDDGI